MVTSTVSTFFGSGVLFKASSFITSPFQDEFTLSSPNFNGEKCLPQERKLKFRIKGEDEKSHHINIQIKYQGNNFFGIFLFWHNYRIQREVLRAFKQESLLTELQKQS